MNITEDQGVCINKSVTYRATVTINESMDNKTVLDQLVMPVAVPQGVGAGAEILSPTDDSTSPDETPDTVNTLQ